MSFKRYTGSAWADVSSVKRYSGSAWVDCESVRRYNGSAWVDVWTNTPWVFSDANSKHVRGSYLYIPSGTAVLSGENLKQAIVQSSSLYLFFTLSSSASSAVSFNYQLSTTGKTITADVSISAGNNYGYTKCSGSNTYPADSTTKLIITMKSGSAPLYLKSIGHDGGTGSASIYEA